MVAFSLQFFGLRCCVCVVIVPNGGAWARGASLPINAFLSVISVLCVFRFVCFAV